MELTSMLGRVVKNAGSERRASALFGISQSSFNNWRRARALPNDDQARRLAELLQLDPAFVLAVIHGERAKTKETRATWRRVADAFGKAAALVAVAVAPAIMAPDARAGFNSAPDAPTSRADNTQCTTRRRRRSSASTFAGTLAALGLMPPDELRTR